MQDEDETLDGDPGEAPGPVLFYNDVVIDHFMNPRHVGDLPEAETDGFGLVGDPSCGDQMLLWILDSSLSFADVDGESIVLGLDVQGICVSTGSACSTGDPEPSHVLRAMGLTPRDAQGTVRVSLGLETRAEDLDVTVRALVETAARLRRISSVRGATS